MSKTILPIYQINDFVSAIPDQPNYYYSTLVKHLEQHKFIQRPHKHDFYILVLFTSGSGTHTVDFKTYSVEPAKVFFLSPGQVHSWKLSPDSDGHILFFNPKFYLSVFPFKKLNSYIFLNPHLSPYMKLAAEELMELQEFFTRIKEEYEMERVYHTDALLNYTDLLLISLLRAYPQRSQLSGSQLDSSFLRLQLIIEENFRNQREILFYSSQMNLTPKQLNSLTKKALGKTLSALIQDRIILEAQRMLVNSNLPVSAIADGLNYSDPSYFARFFRKKTQMSPEKFRLKHQQ